MNKSIEILFLFLVVVCFSVSQNVTIKELKQKFRTYGFFDPSPVVRMNNIYPYFRFDGFTNEPIEKNWKVVRLENQYIIVDIMPEIGGKIWGAIEKSTGFPFIYYNKTVKFRDIAMRGPWTSGGIEFNFGNIGHTPATATPVDYMTKENNDGSVSCFVSSMDLPSRTTWVVEIKLEKDKAYFETKAFWYNSTEYNTSLYTWNNGAINSGNDLHLYYPGSNYIDHDGNLYDWPKADNGNNISVYSENNFGTYKSYHVLGSYTDYFGAYYTKSNIGAGHTSIYEDKPGKKIWIWGLSREGEIWSDLLTDKNLGNEQYVEIQTGMLYNQAIGNKTPFKHSFFEPGAALKFNEMWFPFKNTDGISEANEYGVLNVENKNDFLVFSFCPLREINSNLKITSGNDTIYEHKLNIKPLETFKDSVRIGKDAKYKISLGNDLLSFTNDENKEQILSRPKTATNNFDWNSLYGKYLQAIEYARTRDYYNALVKSLEVLHSDPNYLPALTLLSELYYRRMEYSKALDYIKQALQIDTYDADANYWFGVISKKMKNYYDALDAFGIASKSMKYKSIAYQNLAEIYFIKNNIDRAKDFASRSLDYNSNNISTRKLLAVIYGSEGDSINCHKTLVSIENINPLEHFVRAEKYVLYKDEKTLTDLKKHITCELPHEVYLELAIYYYNIGLTDEALLILKESPSTPIVNYWMAYLYNKKKDSRNSVNYLNKALNANSDFVFPFRSETEEVLKWADEVKNSWKTDYYNALLLWLMGRIEEAGKFLDKCGDEPQNASFYITRANFFKESQTDNVLSDFKRAIDLDKQNWRAYHSLVECLNNATKYSDALVYAKKANGILKNNYVIHFDYAKTLMFCSQYEKSLDELDEIELLPAEGARDGHEVYRASCLMLAIEKIKKNKTKDALKLIHKSLEWPENLGAGKPYDSDIRIELFLEAACYNKLKEKALSENTYKQIDTLTQKYKNVANANLFITALKYKSLGYESDGLKALQEWNNKQPDKISEWCLKQYNTKDFIPLDTESWFIFNNDFNFKLIYEIFKNNVK